MDKDRRESFQPPMGSYPRPPGPGYQGGYPGMHNTLRRRWADHQRNRKYASDGLMGWCHDQCFIEANSWLGILPFVLIVVLIMHLCYAKVMDVRYDQMFFFFFLQTM
jgi:hypothetical protein